jgi:hypothetical protein
MAAMHNVSAIPDTAGTTLLPWITRLKTALSKKSLTPASLVRLQDQAPERLAFYMGIIGGNCPDYLSIAEHQACVSALPFISGITHGDAHPHNFLFSNGKGSVLDFDNAITIQSKTCSARNRRIRCAWLSN